MNPEPETPEPPSRDRGVFGNLPSARPGVRSPRRDGEKQASTEKARKARPVKPPARPRSARSSASGSGQQTRKASAPRREPAGASEPTPSAAPPPEPTSPRRSIEDVAWAGVTVAAEAATLGVRLLSRALGAVRERR
jgi:hypothetical protein